MSNILVETPRAMANTDRMQANASPITESNLSSRTLTKLSSARDRAKETKQAVKAALQASQSLQANHEVFTLARRASREMENIKL